jgi:hypothetical protein
MADIRSRCKHGIGQTSAPPPPLRSSIKLPIFEPLWSHLWIPVGAGQRVRPFKLEGTGDPPAPISFS